MSIELWEDGYVEKDGEDKEVREAEGHVETVGERGGPLSRRCSHWDC